MAKPVLCIVVGFTSRPIFGGLLSHVEIFHNLLRQVYCADREEISSIYKLQSQPELHKLGGQSNEDNLVSHLKVVL